MLSSYINIARRNLLKNKFSSLINIGGLAAGMAVAILISLWIYDETSYNKNFDNYDRLGKLYQFVKFDKSPKATYDVMPIPLAAELKNKYPDFQAISLSSGDRSEVLALGDKKLTSGGAYVEPVFTDMFSVQMIKGTRTGLTNPNSILLSQSLAKALFGDSDPMGQQLSIGDKASVKVAGIYKDFPDNSNLESCHWLAPWQLYVHTNQNVADDQPAWDNNSYNVYAQLKPGASFAAVSAKIKETRMMKDNPPPYHPEFFVFPMSRWHLYAEFKDGVNTGGLIQFVWLFAIIGVFVLLLACINFMNLSTARSEKRAREVGIRKVMGSHRGQLVGQFLSESVLVAGLSFIGSLLLAQLILPWFNNIAGKHLGIPWNNSWFWVIGIAFTLFTGVIAGSYPALFLSSFKPVRVLKGTIKLGRFAAAPRKVLVVLQFTISVLLINGTIIVFREINYAKDRPVGYERAGLIAIQETTPEIYTNYDIIRSELLRTGAAVGMAESQAPITNIYMGSDGWEWKGKRLGQKDAFARVAMRTEYGETIRWKVLMGRDFSKAFATDSMGMILNETAVRQMGLKDPVGQIVRDRDHHAYTVIGVVRDMIQANPYDVIPPTMFTLLHEGGNILNIRLNPALSTEQALKRVEAVFKQYNPGAPFQYTFVDKDYAQKFGNEERIGDLALFFALLAIFISALGLFGLASFVAERRTREIGIRKVLGATLLSLWKLLSREFTLLVLLSLVIAIPLAQFFMSQWLSHYTYRAGMPWWIFVAAGGGALVLTLLTVSYHTIRASLANPTRSLRSE